jgi:methylmalonyl-CoA mutase
MKLFNEFEPVSSKQWKQQIQFELKGADYNETLVWKSPEHIQVRPFYHFDESIDTNVTTKATEFRIGQSIFVFDVDKSIANALDSVKRGAESLVFTIEDEKTDIEKLLNNLPLKSVAIHFHLKFLSVDFVTKIERIAQANNTTIYCNLDPIGHLAREGNWFVNEEKDNFETLNKLSHSISKTNVISIDAGLYQNAGATMVQQLAYALGHATEYFNAIETINQPIVFKLP